MRWRPRTTRPARLRASALAILALLGCGARTSLSESVGDPIEDGGEPSVVHDASGRGTSRGAADGDTGDARAGDGGTVDAGTRDADPGQADVGACGSGERTLANTGQNQPSGLAIDAKNVYWTDGDSVMEVPLCGGTPTTLASDNATFGAVALAVDARNLYWLTSSYAADGGSESTVVKMRLSDGAPTTLAAAQSPTYLVVDSTSVYWTDIGVDDSDCTVMKVPIGGGAATTLVSGQVSANGIYGLALDAASVYWTTGGTTGGAVVKAPIAGGAPTTLATGQDPGAIAVDDTRVYWVNALCGAPTSGGGECTSSVILSVPLGGGVPTTLASTEGLGNGIALDAVNVYWTTASDVNEPQFGMGPALSVPKSGGTPTTLASGQYDPTAIAVNAKSVVWLSSGLSNADGTVMGASVREVTPK